MSIQNTLSKLYVRFVFRDGEYNSLKTQKEFNVPDPPRGIAARCEKLEPYKARGFWIDKANRQNGLLIYLHGGAFYFGPVKEHWDYFARICKQTQMAGLLIDYGFARHYRDPSSLVHRPLEENQNFLGTLQYASLNTHLGLSMDIYCNVFPS